MKTIALWIITLSFPILFISCSTDEFTGIPETNSFKNENVLKRYLLPPENNENEYDTLGRIHNSILEIYLSENHNHTTVEDINDEIQHLIYDYRNTELRGISATIPIELIIDIINFPETSLNRIVLNSHLSNSAKTSLSNFINSLLLLEDEDYTAIYEFIVLYETTVIENTLFNSEDKRIILTTTSIARYSSYYQKGRKDKDWEILVGNIVATVSGALYDPLVAINMALVTEISLSTLFTN